MNKSVIEAIFSGKKTVETRFSKNRLDPYGQVSPGDLVYFKPSGEEILGQFKVKKVIYFEGLEVEDIQKIFTDYGDQINSGNVLEDESYEKVKLQSRFGTLIFITQVERFITSPIKFKKSDRRGWVVLN